MRLEPCDSVVLTVTASAIISDRPCIVQGASVSPAAAVGTLSLYDPIAQGVTTTVGATLRIQANAAANGATGAHPCSASGVAFQNGCIAVVTGAGALATVTSAKI